jgi:hypothetical protein
LKSCDEPKQLIFLFFQKTTVQKIRDARGFAYQTLGKFDQKARVLW